WCDLPQRRGLACHQVAEGAPHCALAPSAYREGDTSRQMGQGASPPASADPLVLRHDSGSQTGDGTPRQTAPGGGWGPLGDVGAQSPGGDHPMPTWVSYPPVAPGVYPEKQRHWQTPPLDSVYEGPSHAGALPVGP